IPQFGTKHSLNVSVAAGILIWDVASKISAAQKSV
ncbi:MAG: TrmH family RNA methyltransferase, partial [Dysgonamonadaceae bacterium]|nr:TrmH family RNA methyltransferase [Dysgonamonadaceae bacterium]